MRRSLTTVLAAGLALCLAGSAAAQERDSRARHTLRDRDGTVQYQPPVGHDRFSSLSAGDQRVLNDFYGRQMYAAAVLAAHLNQLPAGQNPQMVSMLGRMMTEHLSLASRARQIYRANDLTIPEVTSEVDLARMAGEDPPRMMTRETETAREQMRHMEGMAQNRELAALMRDSRSLMEMRMAMLRDMMAPGMGEERVAGAREEQRGDNQILTLFYGAQMEEVSRLRSQADALRTAGNTRMAERFMEMVQAHQGLADAAAGMLRSRGEEVPMGVAHPPYQPNPMAIVMHEAHHHRGALRMLEYFHSQASDPAIRQLMERAMEGTRQHLRILSEFGS